MTITPAIVIALCLICFVTGFLMSVFIFTHRPKHKERVFDIKTETEADAETEADVEVEVEVDDNDNTFNVLSTLNKNIK